MQAVILVGGLGTRLRPITYKIPKHMVRIGNKPFLEYLISMLNRNGINEVVLCVGYLWEQIRGYFGNGSKLGVKIKYSTEKKLMGTGGAIKGADRHLKDDFFVIYGDSYLEINYKKLMDFHKKFNKTGVLVVYGNKANTSVKNNVEIDELRNVVNYSKKNPNRGMEYVDAGVSVFKRSLLKFIPNGKKVSLEEDIFPKLIKRRELCAFKSRNRFYDIGTMQRLKAFRQVIS